MTLDETKQLLLLIKGIHLGLVITDISIKSWWFQLAQYQFEDVIEAARYAMNHKTYFDTPEPTDIVKQIEQQYQLEWDAKAICEFIRRNAWNSDIQQVCALCPPNVADFLQSRWKTLVNTPEFRLQDSIAGQMQCYQSRTQQYALPERVQKMIQEVNSNDSTNI